MEALTAERLNFKQKERTLLEYSATYTRLIKNKGLTYTEACHRLRSRAQKKYTLYPRIIQSALDCMDNLLDK